MKSHLKHVVMFSGGAGSWATAKRVVERHGIEGVVLLFADTMIEDEDLYRFIAEASVNVGVPMVKIADGRTPWQVFSDVKFIGNSRVDPCSKILKRDIIHDWMTRNALGATMYIGIDWSEEHRFVRAKERWSRVGFLCEAPLCDAPYLSKSDISNWMNKEGIKPPRLYAMGFPHNNCGGFCIKAGQAHFRLLLEKMPERYAEHEKNEDELRKKLGKDVSILRDRTGGKTRPMTLREFRLKQDFDKTEWGGCGCFEA